MRPGRRVRRRAARAPAAPAGRRPTARRRSGGSAGCWWPGRATRRPTECPVSASGTRVSSDPANSTGVQDQRSTGMLAATVTISARSAVQRHAAAVSTRPATDQISTGFRCVAQRLARDIGDGQRHQQRRAHRPDSGGDGGQPQRAVAGGVEHSVVLRRHEERREQERADRGRRRRSPRPPARTAARRW